MNEEIKVNNDKKVLEDTDLENADGGKTVVKAAWQGFKDPSDYERYYEWLKATGKKED
ncbi:MAG: hypothetical protein ACI4WM_10595 [Erysipelotrichaceae bacterium]